MLRTFVRHFASLYPLLVKHIMCTSSINTLIIRKSWNTLPMPMSFIVSAKTCWREHCLLQSRSLSYEVIPLTIHISLGDAHDTRELRLPSQTLFSVPSRYAIFSSRLRDLNN